MKQEEEARLLQEKEVLEEQISPFCYNSLKCRHYRGTERGN